MFTDLLFLIVFCEVWSLTLPVTILNFALSLQPMVLPFFGDNISLLEAGLQLLGSRLIGEEIWYLLQ